MHLKTRQRLIGLLLLLSLALILALFVLRSPEQMRVALDMSIPEPPPITEPEVAPVISEREQAATDQQIDEEKQMVAAAGERRLRQPTAPSGQASGSGEPDRAAPPRPEPGTDDAPLPGFTVQVASFSDTDNASALVERLRDAGYNAYHRTLARDGNTWERVYVGPEIKRKDAESLRQRLADDQDFALEGLVKPFVP